MEKHRLLIAPLFYNSEKREILDGDGNRIASKVFEDEGREIVRSVNLQPEIEAFMENITSGEFGRLSDIKHEAERLLRKIARINETAN